MNTCEEMGNITYGQEKQTQMLDLKDRDFKEP